jgi:hypothetical protein
MAGGEAIGILRAFFGNVSHAVGADDSAKSHETFRAESRDGLDGYNGIARWLVRCL